jgi:hypothetical protein
MNLSAPKQVTFWIAVVLAVLSVVFKIVPSLNSMGVAGWLALIAFLVLAAGNVFEGL